MVEMLRRGEKPPVRQLHRVNYLYFLIVDIVALYLIYYLHFSVARKTQGVLIVDQKGGILLCQVTLSLLRAGIWKPAKIKFGKFYCK